MRFRHNGPEQDYFRHRPCEYNGGVTVAGRSDFGLIVRQGVDDVIAMLLAFSAKPEELDILMLSLTFGNVDVQR